MDRDKERRLLQFAVAMACTVPLIAGGAGVVAGIGMLGNDLAYGDPDLESHFRYLSGLLLGVGLAFAASLPTIERRTQLFLILSCVVVIGGLARLAGIFSVGPPTTPHLLALVMELVVVPILFTWQRRIARLFRS